MAEDAKEMCKCGKNPATPDLHSCRYQADINDDPTPSCTCCGDCEGECAADI